MQKQQTYHYVLLGEPHAIRSGHNIPSKMWHEQKQLKAHYGISLESQHLKPIPFSGPLEISYEFFFAPKKRTQYHIQKPDIFDLVALIQEAAHKVLFDNSCIIVRSTINKHYADPARTEIVIREIT